MEMLLPFLASPSVLQTLKGLMVALGLLAVGLGLRAHYKGRSDLKWPAVTGQVIRSQLESTATAQTRLTVAFRYKVHKRSIESRPLSVEIPAAPAAANRTLERLSNGRKTTLYYDPAHPDRVQLDNPSSGNWLEAVAAGSALILFALYAF